MLRISESYVPNYATYDMHSNQGLFYGSKLLGCVFVKISRVKNSNPTREFSWINIKIYITVIYDQQYC